MSAANNGGPAFPFTDSASPLESPGMTLRDYFAAKAMQSFAHPDIPCEWLEDAYGTEEISVAAYKQADAMLKARLL